MNRPKLELGQVHYFTTILTFPKDRDQWVRQVPIPGASTTAIWIFVNRLRIKTEHKVKLCKTLEASWKDHNGVWVQMRIERTRRNDVNGTRVKDARV